MCDAKAHIGADGIAEETYCDAWTDDGLVAHGKKHNDMKYGSQSSSRVLRRMEELLLSMRTNSLVEFFT